MQQGIKPGYKLLSNEKGIYIANDHGTLIPSVHHELVGADVTLPPQLQKKLKDLNSDYEGAQISSQGERQNAEGLAFEGRKWFYGIGVNKSQRKGAEYYRKAAKLGHAPSAYRLGMCYEEGSGVPINLDRALDFYEQVRVTCTVPHLHPSTGIPLGSSVAP